MASLLLSRENQRGKIYEKTNDISSNQKSTDIVGYAPSASALKDKENPVEKMG